MTSPDILGFFARYIEAELGIVYAEHNGFQLQNRLEEIAKLMGAPSVEALYLQVSKGGISGSFKQLLLDAATNNETSFFRDPKTFDAIQENVLKNLSGLIKPHESLRAWSAASSTGQEALSLAMLIKEFGPSASTPFSILATDISERVLQKARAATYTQLEVQRGLSDHYLQKYFQQKDLGQWVARPEICKHIEFKKLNLKDPFASLGGFHLVLCRNVLIYQKVEAKREIIGRILNQLEPNGFLVLGAGETLFGISENFDQVRCEGVVLYRKKTSFAMAA